MLYSEFDYTNSLYKFDYTNWSRLIRAEHRAETARTELAQAWKQRLMSKGGGAAAAPAAGAAVAAEELPFEDVDAQ